RRPAAGREGRAGGGAEPAVAADAEDGERVGALVDCEEEAAAAIDGDLSLGVERALDPAVDRPHPAGGELAERLEPAPAEPERQDAVLAFERRVALDVDEPVELARRLAAEEEDEADPGESAGRQRREDVGDEPRPPARPAGDVRDRPPAPLLARVARYRRHPFARAARPGRGSDPGRACAPAACLATAAGLALASAPAAPAATPTSPPRVGKSFHPPPAVSVPPIVCRVCVARVPRVENFVHRTTACRGRCGARARLAGSPGRRGVRAAAIGVAPPTSRAGRARRRSPRARVRGPAGRAPAARARPAARAARRAMRATRHVRRASAKRTCVALRPFPSAPPRPRASRAREAGGAARRRRRRRAEARRGPGTRRRLAPPRNAAASTRHPTLGPLLR